MQPLTMRTRNAPTTVPELLATHKRNDALLFVVIFVIVLSITPLLVLAGATIGFSLVLGGLVVLGVAALIVRWPVAGLYVVVGIVVLIEAEPLPTPILTDRLNVFYWPPALEGLIERPIGFFFIFIVLVFVCHRLIRRQQPLQSGPLLVPLLLYLLCVFGGVIHGMATGGDLKWVVVEIRPFWYMFVAYVLAYNLVTLKSHVRTLLWIVILGAFVKTVQGLYIYLIVFHGDLTDHHEIMAHEESFFFVSLLLLAMLFCLHHRYRPQLYATLLILPFVLVALVANQRRADYVALLLGLVVVWALIFWTKPQARTWLAVGMFVCVVIGTGYIAAFAHSTTTFAAPARGIVSVFFPDPSTDPTGADSNLYRTIENYDLIYTVKQNPVFGLGFGKPFPEPILLTSNYPNVAADDPIYNYVPHNTVYWIWMRLGAIGFFVFWYLFGAIIVRGCLIARQLKDSYLQLVAIYIIGMMFIEIVVAYADYQLFSFRTVIYIGLLAGVLMKLPALDEKRKSPIDESIDSISQSPIPRFCPGRVSIDE